jgi:hypothetical protein
MTVGLWILSLSLIAVPAMNILLFGFCWVLCDPTHSDVGDNLFRLKESWIIIIQQNPVNRDAGFRIVHLIAAMQVTCIWINRLCDLTSPDSLRAWVCYLWTSWESRLLVIQMNTINHERLPVDSFPQPHCCAVHELLPVNIYKRLRAKRKGT